MIRPLSAPLPEEFSLHQLQKCDRVSEAHLLSRSESLSRAQSREIRVQRSDLEHISEVLTRISATLDRQPLGKISKQGGGIPPGRPPQKIEQTPPLVNPSYPLQGGVA